MMKLIRVALPALVAAAMGLSCTTKTDNDPQAEEIFFADPTIFTENGHYYLAGTRSNQTPLGFVLLESDDLQHWHEASVDSMMIECGKGVYGEKGFWAPQIFKDGDRYTVAYTANEQVAVAHGDSITALFSQETVAPMDSTAKNIDPFIFRDSDGRYYMYHVRFDNGNFLWVADYDPATASIDTATLERCFVNDQPWEQTDAYPCVPIMEGPTVINLDGTYYLFYSANHFMSDDYAVGYATAPTPRGPWTKNPASPIIHRNIVGEKGSGHGDVFTDNDGRLRYVYHVHYNDSTVSPRRTRIVSLNVDKSKGQPYTITADTATIIRPVRR